MKKHIGLSILLSLSLLSLWGCGAEHLKKNSSSKEEAIRQEMKFLVDSFDQHDVEGIYEHLSDDIKNDDVKESIIRFLDNYSKSDEAYVNPLSYWGEENNGVEEIDMVSGIIVTDDNIYSIKFDFIPEEEELTKLWIITGETESEENLNWEDRYRFGNTEKFAYADYYDTGAKDYRLIWGMIVKWDDSAQIVNQEEVESTVGEASTIDDVVSHFGVYGCDVQEATHFYCYPSSKEGEYIQIYVDEEGIITSVENTDDIYYGIMGLESIK